MFDGRWLLVALAFVVGPAAADAQDWRDVTSFRQRADEPHLDVHLRYGAGVLDVRPGVGGELYRVGIRYDSDVFDPITEYRNGRLEVGVEGVGRGVRLKNNEAGDLSLALSPDVSLDLDLDFGAVEAHLELGGLQIRAIDVETGASDTELRFSRPNPLHCDRFDVSMGAAAFEAVGLANANCSQVTVEGGVGDVTLDFSGEWRRNIDAKVTMALGSATLIVPENVGVSIDKQTFLVDFDRNGFEKRGSMYYSRNWETTRHRLAVDLEGAFGTIEIRWARPTGTVTP